MGGPMMGVALDRIDVGIIKANNAVLVQNAGEASDALRNTLYPMRPLRRLVSDGSSSDFA